MVQHERLGVVRWELPGGHLEPGETAEDAAIREAMEETGVTVVPGRVIAECLHEWRGRTVEISYFEATPQTPYELWTADRRIRAVEWMHPARLSPGETSALAWSVVQHVAAGNQEYLRLRATHHETASGWEPVITWSGLGSRHVS